MQWECGFDMLHVLTISHQGALGPEEKCEGYAYRRFYDLNKYGVVDRKDNEVDG